MRTGYIKHTLVVLAGLSFLAAGGFSGCRDGQADFVTKDGIAVYTNGLQVSPEDVETMIDIGVAKMDAIYFDVAEGESYGQALQGAFREIPTTLSFVEGYISCDGEDGEPGECSGLTTVFSSYPWRPGRAEVEVTWYPCLAYTSLVHELEHVWSWYLTGSGDPGHTDPQLWSGPASVEWQSWVAGTEALCPWSPLSD